MRRLLLRLHRYAGLLSGLFLALLGLTGSLLVFDHALDEIWAPETVTPVQAGSSAPLADVLAAARAAVPGGAEPLRLQLARQPGSPHVVRFPPLENAPGPLEVSVAPGDARVLAVRTWGEYPMSWIYRLHYTLLAGSTGKTVVGAAGLVLLFLCLSGVCIGWPRTPGEWRRVLSIKRGGNAFRFCYDLHRTMGMYLLPLLVLLAFSGAAMVFPPAVKALVGMFCPVDERPKPHSGPGIVPLTVDQAVAIGGEVFPGAQLKRVSLPQGERGAFELTFRQEGEPWSNHGASAVWVDQYSGEVLAVWNALQVSAGSRFLSWQFPLHNGDLLGLTGRWLICLSGPGLALLCGTGLYVYWRRRSHRFRHRNRQSTL